MPAFTCDACGKAFDLPASVVEKYPNWTPTACMDCRDKTPARGRSKAKTKAGKSRGSVPGENLTTTQVLERFSEGPDTGVFTDGSCQGNPGRGGWGAVYTRSGEVVEQRNGAEPETTNNRMEFTAIIEGLRMLPETSSETIYTDSQLVVNTLTKWAAGWEKRGWKRKDGPVKNLDLVKCAFELALSHPNVTIAWIKAHDGSRWNEYADAVATGYLRDEL